MYASGSARDFVMVGVPDTAVHESRERIKSALINSGSHKPDSSPAIARCANNAVGLLFPSCFPRFSRRPAQLRAPMPHNPCARLRALSTFRV